LTVFTHGYLHKGDSASIGKFTGRGGRGKYKLKWQI
jgi:hypothetical protein